MKQQRQGQVNSSSVFLRCVMESEARIASTTRPGQSLQSGSRGHLRVWESLAITNSQFPTQQKPTSHMLPPGSRELEQRTLPSQRIQNWNHRGQARARQFSRDFNLAGLGQLGPRCSATHRQAGDGRKLRALLQSQASWEGCQEESHGLCLPCFLEGRVSSG